MTWKRSVDTTTGIKMKNFDQFVNEAKSKPVKLPIDLNINNVRFKNIFWKKRDAQGKSVPYVADVEFRGRWTDATADQLELIRKTVFPD